MSAYRSAYQHIVGMRLAEVKLARETVEPLLPRLRSIRSARIARMLAGAVGIAGAVVMVVDAFIDDGGAATHALLGSVAASAGTYLLARALFAFGGRFGRARSWTLPKLTGHLDTDLARIDASDPFQALPRRLEDLEVWSTALPLAAISLLAPLTLHYAFLALTDSESPESFAKWIRISLVIVGHAHLALVALAIAFARRMKKLTTQDLALLPTHREWAKAWGLTILVSAFPGLLLLAVPPILTAITGIAFIPFMFALMRRRLLNERTTMALADEASAVRVEVDATLGMSAFEEAVSPELAVADERSHLVARM